MSPDELEKQAVVEFFGRRPDGFFVEVGANDPHLLSQTWPLEQLGWTGLLVEPLQACADKLAAARPRSRVVRAACAGPDQRGSAVFHVADRSTKSGLARHVDDQSVRYIGQETVPVVTLDDLLTERPPARLDFVSIDVEGTELDVLRGFDLARWRPELVLLEDRVSSLDKHRFFLTRGYRLLRRTGFNGWYVPRPHSARPPRGEGWRTLKKYYLGLPFRRLKLAWQARRRQRATG